MCDCREDKQVATHPQAKLYISASVLLKVQLTISDKIKLPCSCSSALNVPPSRQVQAFADASCAHINKVSQL